MERLGTFVVASALTAPLGGTVAADTPDTLRPSSREQAHPALFDLNGWYAHVAAGDVWSRASVAPATFGHAARTAHGSGSGFGKGVAAHWPRAGMTAKGLRAGAPGRAQVARAVFDRTTFKKLAAQQVRFRMRWSSDYAVLAK